MATASSYYGSFGAGTKPRNVFQAAIR